MAALDRSGPVFYVRIGNAGSQSVDRLPADLRVMSMTFDEEEAKADVLTLTVDNKDLANFDTPLFAVGNVVEVCWGYPGAMGKVRETTITKVTGSTTLKVECKGKSHVGNLIAKNRVFTNVRRSDVAAQLGGEHGLGAYLFVQQTPVVYPQITQARETDAQFLRQLAHKEGYDYYEDSSGFHFHERKLGSKPVKRFTYYTDPGGGDVESFTVEGDIAAKPALIIAAGRDPLSKENFAPYANNQSLPGRPTNAPVAIVNVGKNGAVDAASLAKAQADATASGTHTIATTETTKEGAAAQANAAFKRSEQKAIKVTLHCVGDALIEAKQTIELHGFGRVLDGNYHVTSAKHAVGPGFKMTLKTTRSGVGSQAGMGVNAPDTDGKVNSAKGPASADQTPWAKANPDGSISWQVGGQKP